MTEERANKVYDILVNIGGAYELYREGFVFHHTGSRRCEEYRFQGKLGFGGKYRKKRNKVDCYKEDETPETLKLIEKINVELSKI